MKKITSLDDYLEQVKKLLIWSNAYYIKNDPLASDEEYDTLYHTVKEFEDNNPQHTIQNSPTTTVGGVAKSFVKTKHNQQMWSQQDIFTEEELVKWLVPFTNTVFRCETKYDGASLKLTYHQGILISAVTRGDGLIGENVITNARLMQSIPLQIDYLDTLDIEGEVVITHKDFSTLNQERTNCGEELFANPRNAAAGSLRVRNKSEFTKRKLTFYPWNIPSELLSNIHSLENINTMLTDWGFLPSPLNYTKTNLKGIMVAYNDLMNQRKQLPVAIDGMVIKVMDRSKHASIGYTSKFPKWSCAFKFPAVEKTTTILGVTVQVGRTGRLTPVGILTPTDIDGSTVRRVTLHNYTEITTKDIRIGDQVILIKSGDVIPKITKVFKDRRTGKEQRILPPKHCPDCNHEVTVSDIFVFCTNTVCPSIVCGTIEFFGGRDYMNIHGLGASVTKDLVDNQLVRDVRDLYKLSYAKLETLTGYEDKKINNLLQAIDNSKGVPLHKFLASLGIHKFGRHISKVLCNKFGFDILSADKHTLLEVNGVGEEIADSFLTYVKENKDFLNELIETVQPVIETSVGSKYKDMNIVLTGSMGADRNSMKKYFEDEGAVIKNTVSVNTNLLVYGDKPGSKLAKAKKLNIPVKYYTEV